MKNICFLINNMSNSGGTERVTSIISNELINYKYNVSILSVSDCQKPFFNVNDSIKIFSLYPNNIPLRKIFTNSFKTIWLLRNFVILNKIDTLIVVDSIFCLFTVPALAKLNIKHICWEHFNFKVNFNTKLTYLARRWAARYCNYIVTLTKRDKYLWEEGLKVVNAKIVPIANPVTYEINENMASMSHKRILAVGRLTYQKGFDLLLDAWADFCKKDSEWILRIIGQGKEESSLKLKAKNLKISDRIEFIKATKSIEYYYKTSSFFCMSSRFEGLPMVLLEAQAYGLPIISFDCDTGPSELIEHNINGYLVQPLNTKLLAKKLYEATRLSSYNYEQISDAAKNNSQYYKIEYIINLWIEILDVERL